ncbi:hypothetical protein jhhlp_006283 [Lomentospora prolificans]|uniref:Zn(2)-C6 fungal-type domain-containing protein n=1 Tax=Lomentospora prolificans TaxID=41688 RepID=A0A2N3N5G9_9PEZI|nr:hypothetical protein jhhlp_006283 [Lomentospora prolificans]
MDSGQLDSNKRPRLSMSSWGPGAPHGPVSLPHPAQAPLPSGVQHPAPPGQYQPHYPPRNPESHPPPPPPPTQVSPLHPHRPGQHPPHPDDRRHHEQEPYSSLQDFRQPPPSPAQVAPPQGHPPPHGPPPNVFPPPYPVRDPAIKKDPADEHIAPPRRPQSTGNIAEPPPVGAHPAAPPPLMNSGPHQPPPPQASTPGGPPAPYGDDPRARHMSYDAGPPMPGTPGAYGRPGPAYPPPPPPQMQHQQPYDSMYPNEPYYNVSYTTTAKRKATRASQACDSCRALKAKCDETKPCKNCREKNVECKYREPAPKATDKAQADILEGVAAIQATLKLLVSKHTNMDRRVNKIERALSQIYPQLDLKTENETVGSEKHEFEPVDAGDDVKPIASGDEISIDGEPKPSFGYSSTNPGYNMPDEEMEPDPGPVLPPGELSIPTNHTTGAGHLLNWPCINAMVQRVLVRENLRFPAEFPIREEEQRGILRVYGRGEGRDPIPRDRDVRAEHGTTDIPEDVSHSDMSSPVPGDASGHIGGFSPVNISEYSSSNPRTPVLTPSGVPDFSEQKVWMYVRSFEENILNMHPIILPKDLRAMVQIFLNSIPKPPPKPTTPAQVAKFVQPSPQSTVVETIGSKRKRSPAMDAPDTPQIQFRTGRPARTINNAVVLTVLALGKICLQRDHVPDVVHDYPSPRSNYSKKNGYPGSPGHASSPEAYTPTYSSGMASPKDSERPSLSRRQSFQGPKCGYQPRRNYDTIPGLEYFAIATDIIGNQLGGNTMNHVYAGIFAGLFHGQLGRVVESHAYIAHACNVLMNIMRPSLKRLSVIKDTRSLIRSNRDNQLIFAFWTCLQLESDIVAEIPRHQSGILAQEEHLPYPNPYFWQQQDPQANVLQDSVLTSYMAQLYLRKHLNQIHRMLYGSEGAAASVDLAQVNEAQARVADMTWVGPMYRFNEDDPPATDILSARLRAKYWGAQVITYRPCIKQILDRSHELRSEPDPSLLYAPYEELPLHIVQKVQEIPTEVWAHARKGIRSLIESTQAFHGLGDKRPIITNVFGTAHAQWGNLVVLSACYCDPFLRQELDEAKLKDLFLKTIAFFGKVVGHTSALAFDKRLLEGLYRELFEVHGNPNMSFSSGASGQTPIAIPSGQEQDTVMAPVQTPESLSNPAQMSTGEIIPTTEPHLPMQTPGMRQGHMTTAPMEPGMMPPPPHPAMM